MTQKVKSLGHSCEKHKYISHHVKILPNNYMTIEPWKINVAKYHVNYVKVMHNIKYMRYMYLCTLKEHVWSGYFTSFTKRHCLSIHMGWYLPLPLSLCLCYMIDIKDKNQPSHSIFDYWVQNYPKNSISKLIVSFYIF